MEYDTFLKEKERVSQLSVEEQKAFYANILKQERLESSIRLQAYFQYAVLFYYEGDFRKAREILEPFAISYQSYAYIPEMISCFNLMGVASQCEGEYVMSRYFYNVALKVVKEQQASRYFAYEYNNISLTYIAEGDYETALRYIQKAESYLLQSDETMGAYVYLNKADIYQHLNRLDASVQAFETSIRAYKGTEILPDDTLICGTALFYKLKDRKRYAAYIQKILDKLQDMYASEFIDACQVVFHCSLDDEDYTLVETIIAKMDAYMQTHPQEKKVGVRVEGLKYTYAKKIGDRDAMLAALEKKDHYYEQIVSRLEQQRADSMDEYLETHKHLQEAVQNEMQANRAKTQFLANMSHDIRTPMNAIVGITDLMGHALHDPQKMRGYLTKMQLSSRYMLGLINDLLDMNKIENGMVRLHIEPMKLAQQMEQISDIIHTQTKEKGQHFAITTHNITHDALRGDEVHLRQILLNVLTNAVKYTPEGGSIRLDITEQAGKNPGYASYCFTVTDDGIGMTPELVARIYEPFQRGEDSVINKIQGTGLGMTITKNLVDLMGGFIQIDSAVGKGTCIAITLEFACDDTQTDLKGQETGQSVLKGMRFLCAEDNKLNAEILTAILEAAGASATVCPDGAAIVETFASVKPGDYDAILMDIQMPNMNGYEATQHIRNGSNPLGAIIPIIAVTANAFDDDVNNSLAAGMNAHISKPIDMARLEQTIRNIKNDLQMRKEGMEL